MLVPYQAEAAVVKVAQAGMDNEVRDRIDHMDRLRDHNYDLNKVDPNQEEMVHTLIGITPTIRGTILI